MSFCDKVNEDLACKIPDDRDIEEIKAALCDNDDYLWINGVQTPDDHNKGAEYDDCCINNICQDIDLLDYYEPYVYP